jgi:hypothetical protein
MSLTPMSSLDLWEVVDEAVARLTRKLVHHRAARRVKGMADAATTMVARAEERVLGSASKVLLPSFPRPVQGDDFSCGAQVAFAIAAFYGRARSVSAVMKALGTTTEGTDSGQLAAFFRARDLRARAIASASMEELRSAIRAGAPVIVSMDGDHWAAVYGFERGAVYLADPALNRSPRVRILSAEFRRRWNGWAMVVSA